MAHLQRHLLECAPARKTLLSALVLALALTAVAGCDSGSGAEGEVKEPAALLPDDIVLSDFELVTNEQYDRPEMQVRFENAHEELSAGALRILFQLRREDDLGHIVDEGEIPRVEPLGPGESAVDRAAFLESTPETDYDCYTYSVGVASQGSPSFRTKSYPGTCPAE